MIKTDKRAGKKINIALAACLLLLAGGGSTAFAATYYVAKTGNDGNPGTQTQPWLTVQRAANVIVAGDTVNISAGSYGEMVTASKNGTSGAPIVFTGPATAVVNGFNLNGNYITVSGLGIGAASTYPAGVTMTGTGDIATGIAMNLHGTLGVQSGFGFQMNGNNCSVLNSNITGVSVWTVFQITGNNCLVQGCVSHDQHDVDCFRVWGIGNIIRGNEMYNHDNPRYDLWHADFIQTWGYSGAVSNNILIENNYVHDNQTQIGNTSNDGVSGLHDWTLRNNLFVNTQSSFFSGLPNTHFYNNTFYKCGTVQDFPIFFYGSTGYSSVGSSFINNALAICGIAPQNAWIGAVGSYQFDLSTITIDHNFFCGTAYGLW